MPHEEGPPQRSTGLIPPQERKQLIKDNARRMRTQRLHQRKMTKVKNGSIVDGPMRPWMRRYAAWVAMQPKRPTGKEKLVFLRRYLQAPIQLAAIRKLEAKPEFRAYFEELDADAIKQAKAEIEASMSEYVSTHLEGMRMAVEAKDHKAIPSFTVPILDRAMPKREDLRAAAQVVVINFGADDPRIQTIQRALNTEMMEAEVVVEETPSSD